MNDPAERLPLGLLQSRFLDSLLRCDEAAARATIEQALDSGHSATSVYLSIITAALIEVGERWHAGAINVAVEHAATAISELQMSLVRQRARARERLGASAVVSCIEGERHALGARLVADFLHLDGWDVAYLGATAPSADLVAFCAERRPALVALSVTLPENLPRLQQVATSLRRHEPRPALLAGGRALLGADGPGEVVGVDWLCSSALEALRVARRLVGLPESQQGLAAYLTTLGARLLEQRRARGLSQQQLARLADLDRTYISAVERGKQNVTVGALMKLAHALDTPIDHLLVHRPS